MRVELSEQEAMDIVKTIQEWMQYISVVSYDSAPKITDRSVRLAELCVRLSELYPDAIIMVVDQDEEETK